MIAANHKDSTPTEQLAKNNPRTFVSFALSNSQNISGESERLK
jgi:hypothetical protein